MIRLEVEKGKNYMRDSFVVRANEPMRLSVDVTETGQIIVFGYPGIEDDLEQDPVLFYDSDSDMNETHEYKEDQN